MRVEDLGALLCKHCVLVAKFCGVHRHLVMTGNPGKKAVTKGKQEKKWHEIWRAREIGKESTRDERWKCKEDKNAWTVFFFYLLVMARTNSW